MGGNRDVEIGSIVDLAASGRPIGVLGEPGMGISTVLARTAERLRGPAVRTGALRALRTVPFLPLSRALGIDAGRDPAALDDAVVARVGTGTLVIDDLQWADAATLSRLGGLAVTTRLLVGIRLGDEGSGAAQNALMAAGGVHVRLAPMDRSSSLELARARRPDLTVTEAERLATEAAGNPLVLEQLLATGKIGGSLAEALRGAVDGLGPDARRLLAALAERPEGVPRHRVGPESVELLDAGLVTATDGLVTVRHRLVAAAALEGLDDGSRTSVHRFLAELAETAGRQAHHLAAAGDVAAALPLARAAAEQAAPDERHHLLALASRCAEGDDRLELAVAAIDAAIAAWDRSAARTLAEEVYGRPGARDVPEVLAAVGEARARDGATAEAREAVAQIGATASRPVRGRARAAEALAWSWPAWRPDDAATAAREAGELDTTPTTAAALAVAGLVAGDPDWAAGLAGLPQELAPLAAMWAGMGIEAADALCPSGPPDDIELLTTILAFHATADCDGTAVRLRRIVDDAGRLIDRELATAHLVVALADSGRTAAAADLAGRALATEVTPAGEAFLLWGLVEAEIAGSRLVKATKAASRASGGIASPARCLTQVAAGWAAALAPGPSGAPEPMPEPGWTGLHAAVLEQEALILRWNRSTETAAAFDEAAAAWARWHRRGALRCRWAAADSRLASDPDSAIDALQALETEAAALGQRPFVARVRASLRSAGVRTRPSRGQGRGPLSAREVEVLELVRLGFTTMEAAQSLGVASSTVETQIESAMRKLGARTRLQAAVEMVGLVP